MPDREQTMPALSSMITEKYGVREWLTYYLNIWQRNLTARLIDMQSDAIAKKANPDLEVELDDHREAPVKVRLEHRKILVQDSRNLIASIQSLLALDDAALAATYGVEALKVAEDMIPKPENATPALAKYKVINDTGVEIGDKVYAKDMIVELDPLSANAIGLLKNGVIALDGAPSPEAKV